MPIEGFNPQEFAKSLAGQAKEVIPADLPDSDKNYVVNIVFKFCLMAGEALAGDANAKLNADQAILITQFIGEWSFHKSIDLIRANIGDPHRESVLQKIAFTVFEITKQAILKNLPQEQFIPLVENHVKNAYQQSIEELKKKGVLDEAHANAAKNQSNIDKMATESADANTASISDEKLKKLASLALLLRQLPKDKVESILVNFNETDANAIVQYIHMEDLEQRFDSKLATKTLNSFKSLLPKDAPPSKNSLDRKLFSIIKNANSEKLSNLLSNERENLLEYVSTIYNDKKYCDSPFSPHITKIICDHLEQKLS